MYGLILHTDKKTSYGRINPTETKEIFIRCALITGDFDSRAKFYLHNRKLVEELESLEAKSRRRDIIVDEDILYDFYEKHLPHDVFSGATMDKWLRKNPAAEKLLFLCVEDLMRDEATLVSDALFPDTLAMNGSVFPVIYHFDPGNHCDGVTLTTLVAAINAINPQRCEWLIPGLLQEKIIALIKSLPKQLRKNFVPAPNFAEACVQALEPSDTALCTALANHLKKMTGVLVPYDAWNVQSINLHLLMNFRVIDAAAKVIDEGRDLQAIKNKLSGLLDKQPDAGLAAEQETHYGKNDVGPGVLDDMAETVELGMHGVTIKAYPALVRDGRQINLRALENRKAAINETRLALRLFCSNALKEQIKFLRRLIPDIQNLCLKYSDFGSCETLKSEVIDKTIDEVFLSESVTSEKEFYDRIETGKSELIKHVEQWSGLLTRILDEYRAIRKLIKSPVLSQLDMVADIQQQLNSLFPKNFIIETDSDWLREYPRYLAAIKKRFEKAKTSMTRDRQLRIEYSRLWDEYVKRQASLEKQHIDSQQLQCYRWMLEEYRVSLFAQELRTKFPVSEKRLKTYWNDLSDA